MKVFFYGQLYEDLVLHHALRHVSCGSYIDVGAQHPDSHSVTKVFYELGWSGINVEPVAFWFDLLAKARPRDINLPVAGGDSNGEIVLYEIPDTGLSTVFEEYAKKHAQNGRRYQSQRVPMRRLDKICEA